MECTDKEAGGELLFHRLRILPGVNQKCTHTTKKGRKKSQRWKNYVETFKPKSCGRKWLAT